MTSHHLITQLQLQLVLKPQFEQSSHLNQAEEKGKEGEEEDEEKEEITLGCAMKKKSKEETVSGPWNLGMMMYSSSSAIRPGYIPQRK